MSEKSPDERLYDAALAGDVDAARAALDVGAALQCTNEVRPFSLS